MINIINNLDLEDYLINIIKKCYEVLLEKKKLSISYKNDGTPVSNIDKELSKIICKSLNAYDERVLVISEEKEFLSKDFQSKLEADLELKEEIYKAICDAYILTYKPGDNIGIDDVEIDEEFVNEES